MSDLNRGKIPVHQVVNFFGGVKKSSFIIGVSNSAISQWLKNGFIPRQRCHQIEILSHGHFKADEIISR